MSSFHSTLWNYYITLSTLKHYANEIALNHLCYGIVGINKETVIFFEVQRTLPPLLEAIILTAFPLQSAIWFESTKRGQLNVYIETQKFNRVITVNGYLLCEQCNTAISGILYKNAFRYFFDVNSESLHTLHRDDVIPEQYRLLSYNEVMDEINTKIAPNRSGFVYDYTVVQGSRKG